MSLVTLVSLSPRRPADGAVVPLRFVHNARVSAWFLGVMWRPNVIALPDTQTDLAFDGARFGQGAIPQVGQLRIAVGEADGWPALQWKGAAGYLRTAPWPATGAGDPGDGDFGPELPFRVDDLSVADGVATLTLLDVGQQLERPVTPRLFGTTGNALLDGADVVDLRGRTVPTGWGRMLSVPAVLVDRAHNIWLLLDRAAASIEGVYDGGAAFNTGVVRAGLAELRANVPAEAACDVCLDAGGLTLIRPWTEPTYPLTADVTAVPSTAADITATIVGTRTAIPMAPGTVAAFNSLYPFPCGLYVGDEQRISEALDRLVAGLGGFWRLDSEGRVALGRLAPAAAVASFDATRIVSIERRAIIAPTRRRAVGYARNNRVHSEGEIAAILLAGNIAGLGDLAVQDAVDWASQITGAGKPQSGATRNVNQGSWAAAAVGFAYVVGDEVTDQGSSWTAIAAHAKTAINGPPTLPATANATWQLRAQKGDNGADGVTAGAPAPILVPATADGLIKLGALPQTRQLRLIQGDTDVTAAAGWAIVGTPANLVLGVSSTGAVEVTNLTADAGTAMVRGTLAGVPFDFPIEARKTRDARPQLVVFAVCTFPSSGTLTTLGTTDELPLPADRAAAVNLNAAWESSSGTSTGTFRMQYSTDGGGSWVTMGGDDSVSAIVGEPAALAMERTLAAGAPRLVRFRVQGSMTNVANTFGTSISELVAIA